MSVVILLLSLTLKIPQIKLMLSKKTAKGVSIEAEFSDAVITALVISYNFHNGYAFTTYGENLFLLIQAIVVMYLSVKYGSLKFAKFCVILAMVGGLIVASLINILPEQIYQYNMALLIAFSKFPES
jgi:mannose-P-dolichol utilization defect 1